MTSPNIDHPAEAPEAPATPVDELDGIALDAIASATGDDASPAIRARAEAAVTRAAGGVVAAAHSGVSAARHGASRLAARLPSTIRATRAGADRTVAALQTLPDQTLRSLAATSVGFGAGLSFTRAGRLAAMAGMVPAVVLGTAIAVRPVAPTVPEAANE